MFAKGGKQTRRSATRIAVRPVRFATSGSVDHETVLRFISRTRWQSDHPCVEVLVMTYPQLVNYLRTNSARCRTCAETASDAEAAQTLRQLADKMEVAVSAMEDAERD